MKARLYLLSTVSALALSGMASAADMPVKAPPPPAVISWAGFYLGGHAGIAWLNASETIIAGANISTCASPGRNVKCDLDATGAVFGGQVGYNLQQGQWVFGIEADASWTRLKKSESFATPTPGLFHVINDKIDWLSSVRGRLGWAVGDTLFYGTGGVAVANFNAGFFRINAGARAQFDKTTVGWVAGGGIEKMFNRHWSARAEFLHYGLGRKSLTSTTGGTYTTAFRHDVSVVRLGINFRP